MQIKQYVVRKANGWAVVGEGNSRATLIRSTQQEAVERASAIARNQRSEVVIYGKGGRIRTANDFRSTSVLATA